MLGLWITQTPSLTLGGDAVNPSPPSHLGWANNGSTKNSVFGIIRSPHIKHHPIDRSKNVGPKPYIYIFKTILGGSFTELNPKDVYYIFNYHYDILGIFGAVEYKTYGLFGTSSKFFSKKKNPRTHRTLQLRWSRGYPNDLTKNYPTETTTY